MSECVSLCGPHLISYVREDWGEQNSYPHSIRSPQDESESPLGIFYYTETPPVVEEYSSVFNHTILCKIGVHCMLGQYLFCVLK